MYIFYYIYKNKQYFNNFQLPIDAQKIRNELHFRVIKIVDLLDRDEQLQHLHQFSYNTPQYWKTCSRLLMNCILPQNEHLWNNFESTWDSTTNPVPDRTELNKMCSLLFNNTSRESWFYKDKADMNWKNNIDQFIKSTGTMCLLSLKENVLKRAKENSQAKIKSFFQ